MRTFFLFFLFFVISISAFTQDEKIDSTNNYLQLGFGLMIGEKENALVLDLNIGRKFNRFQLGVGGLVDWYRFTSIPVYIHTGYYAGNQKKILGYLQGGYNFPLENMNTNEWALSDDMDGGFYGESGIGYVISQKKKSQFKILAGYSYKAMSQEIRYEVNCLIPPCPDNISVEKYNFRRVTMRFSWQPGW